MSSRHEQLPRVIGVGAQWATTNVRQKATCALYRRVSVLVMSVRRYAGSAGHSGLHWTQGRPGIHRADRPAGPGRRSWTAGQPRLRRTSGLAGSTRPRRPAGTGRLRRAGGIYRVAGTEGNQRAGGLSWVDWSAWRHGCYRARWCGRLAGSGRRHGTVWSDWILWTAGRHGTFWTSGHPRRPRPAGCYRRVGT